MSPRENEGTSFSLDVALSFENVQERANATENGKVTFVFVYFSEF